MDGMDGTCSMHGDEEICMSSFSGGKSKGRRPFGSPRCRWEGNINMDLKINWMVWRKLDSAGVE